MLVYKQTHQNRKWLILTYHSHLQNVNNETLTHISNKTAFFPFNFLVNDMFWKRISLSKIIVIRTLISEKRGTKIKFKLFKKLFL